MSRLSIELNGEVPLVNLDEFPDESLLLVAIKDAPWYANIINVISKGFIPKELDYNE